MDIENKLFLEYKKYIANNSKYISVDYIYNDTPQQLSDFPTILFLENDVRNSNVSTDRSEVSNELQYKIEIYSKNKSISGQLVSRKVITNELKQLTFKFLINYGLELTSCTKGEYLDLNIDRTIIMAECNINSWNGKIR